MNDDKETTNAQAVAAAVAVAAESLVVPRERDLLISDETSTHKMNVLLHDILRLHRILWKLHDKPSPKSTTEVAAMAQHIISIIKNGKSFELAGLKDVPKPFMKSPGRFLKKQGDVWRIMDEEEITTIMMEVIMQEFANNGELENLHESPYKDLKQWLNKRVDTTASQEFMPEAKDVILFPCNDPTADKMYEQQSGNKTVFNLASQLITLNALNSDRRVEAALNIMKSLDDMIEDKTDAITTTKSSRFLIRTQRDDMGISWEVMDSASAAEFTVIFCFEVFLEKELHLAGHPNPIPEQELIKPSNQPVHEPTDSDVLFGRGGMTNSHPGNRRFRDIIALHRPDYIRAVKMDKPTVARRIVRAIRQGNPPGRFLKKQENTGSWYDVGDRSAAEKTSQGLRERSNAEKRQRSALREALRIRKQDMTDEDGNKKPRYGDAVPELGAAGVTPTLNYVGTNLPVPLSLSMKDPGVVKAAAAATTRRKITKDGKPLPEEISTEGLPPNAVDEDGNILVTDHDILCGRGGLTNHHKGNRRFRDIVALHRPDYVRAPKIQKPSVARVIVRAIRNGDPPGRFLKKDEKTGKWIDIGDKKAAEKTSQALREKTTEEREKLKQSTHPGMGVLLPSPASYLTTPGGIFPTLLATPTPIPTAGAVKPSKDEDAVAAAVAEAVGVKEAEVTTDIVLENTVPIKKVEVEELKPAAVDDPNPPDPMEEDAAPAEAVVDAAMEVVLEPPAAAVVDAAMTAVPEHIEPATTIVIGKAMEYEETPPASEA